MQLNKIGMDTIAAIATAQGAGGIGVVRISGALSRDIAKKILGSCPPPRHATYTAFFDTHGSLLDRGIAIYYPNPHSYTGEDVLELQAHGGVALLQMLLATCIEFGARQAEPGEFTKRAYLNDKLDLAQAEAVADVINASTREAAQSAIRSLSGEFSKAIQNLLTKLIDLRMFVEACLDFPEEEIDFISIGNVESKLAAIQQSLAVITKESKQGNLLRDGIQVVLIGQPNVGKSSLLNQLAREDVAIVTPVAGTTRDSIKTSIQINGVPLHIIDTAGLRETDDLVEKIGIDRTWRALESANTALFLVDAYHDIGEQEKVILMRLPQGLNKIWVHNKIDLTNEAPNLKHVEGETHVYLSAKTGLGIELLQKELLRVAGWQSTGEGVFMARTRHLLALAEVNNCIQKAKDSIAHAEIVAEELRLGQEHLSSITGEFTPDDLLGEIFSKFCIGK